MTVIVGAGLSGFSYTDIFDSPIEPICLLDLVSYVAPFPVTVRLDGHRGSGFVELVLHGDFHSRIALLALAILVLDNSCKTSLDVMGHR